ncbi:MULTISPECIES: L-lactate permease [Ralstonia solanacearum species complex]|uniref:L-lactate permease n=4 Tax=Ralstonia solanacearum species complex TaxID=3116862 RepID=A0A0K1ZM06_RALSL|nr:MULTISPECIES: L-lactate permease [Ralstonia]AKZ26827.1 lactate permease [Ralstonia solanacearum]APC68033.1 L-lactate permease [Ralstonia solanacearum OE1-1]APF87698.1 lactate permease [Ralstonia solanacearum FJAT-1458]ARS55584.1 lactate permease [Ralstonia solanacearum FJAT-91]ESS48682.1 L-lactate permease transmembrane protein [Ralstonia solanacearum SD54]
MWNQVYDPLGNAVWSTVAAGLPVAVLLCSLAFFHMQAHLAAGLALLVGVGIAAFVFGMPAAMAGKAAGLGIVSGLFPIGWIVLNIIFLHRLTTLNGSFKVLQGSISGITEDRRLQLLLVAFSFGAFFEGAAGFGTPVAVTGAILIGLGFSPLAASGLALIANTAPVAYGALGAPIIGLAAVTGLDLKDLSAMIGRQLPFFSVLVPFWLIWAFAGLRGMLQIWPAILVAGVTFAVPQFLVSNFHGPWLVDVIAALVSMGSLTLFLKVWKPKSIWTSTALRNHPDTSKVDPEAAAEARAATTAAADAKISRVQAWLPWVILTVFVFIWGVPQFKAFVDGLWQFKLPIPGLDKMVLKGPPVVPKVTAEAAVFTFNVLSMAGTGILASAVVGGLLMGYSVPRMVKEYWNTIKLTRYSLLTICAMFGIGYLTRYSGLDATLGLAFAHTGVLYPLFGTMLGWLGVALTGSDTASNVLFGGLQKTTSEQLGLSPILMSAANSSGGVMGKMIDAQSIVVASTATKWYGHEGDILRYVFFHSIALAFLVGLLITLQAYVEPFTRMVVPMAH